MQTYLREWGVVNDDANSVLLHQIRNAMMLYARQRSNKSGLQFSLDAAAAVLLGIHSTAAS